MRLLIAYLDALAGALPTRAAYAARRPLSSWRRAMRKDVAGPAAVEWFTQHLLQPASQGATGSRFARQEVTA